MVETKASHGARFESTEAATARTPLARATTLPASAFVDPAVYDLEVERLFRGHWLCAGRVDQVPRPGDWRSLDLLGERLVVARGLDEEVRVLSRVCRHRAAELVQGSGSSRSFQCPYHHWTYKLDGSLVGAPHMEGAEGFDRAECGLPSVRVEVWEGWIFVNLDGRAAPLAASLAPLSELLAGYGMSEMVAEETATYDSPFNWKVLVDNFMEAYHHLATHADTLEPIFPAAASHVPDVDGPCSVLVMPTREGQALGETPRLPGLAPEQQPGLVAAVVYPFHLFAPSGDSMAWYQLLPESHGRFTLRIHTCFRPDAVADPAQRESLDGMHTLTKHIHAQDIEACESVWAGLQSGDFDRGRLSTLEKAIWEFNQWWCRQIA